MLGSASNKSSKFRTKNWFEINDEIRGTDSTNKQIKVKTGMLRSSLCDYSDGYILVKGNNAIKEIKEVINVGADAAENSINKKVVFKNCAPFTNCISKINNTQIDNAECIDTVMLCIINKV